MVNLEKPFLARMRSIDLPLAMPTDQDYTQTIPGGEARLAPIGGVPKRCDAPSLSTS